MGSGIKGVGSGIGRVGSGISATDPTLGSGSHKPWDLDQQFFKGSGIKLYLFVPNQGPKFVTLLESRIRKLGTEMGSAMKKT